MVPIARSAAIVMGFVLVFMWINPPVGRAASIDVRLMRTYGRGPIYFFNKSSINQRVAVLRNASDTAVAFDIEAENEAPVSSSYTVTSAELARYEGIEKAAWIAASASETGDQLSPYYDKEAKAIQLAIWANTWKLSLNSETVKDRDVLARARELLGASREAPPLPDYVDSLDLQIDVVKSTYNEVTLEVRLRNDLGSGFPREKVEIVWDGIKKPPITTDKRGIARFTFPRPSRKVLVAAEWQVAYPAGTLLAPQAPSDHMFVTAEDLTVSLRKEIPVDPSELASGLDLVHQTIQDWGGRLGPFGEQFTATLIFLLLASPYIGYLIKGIRKLIAHVRS